MMLPRSLLWTALILMPAISLGTAGFLVLDWSRQKNRAHHERQVSSALDRRVLQLEEDHGKELRDPDLPRLCDQPDVAEFLGHIERAATRSGLRSKDVEVPKSAAEGRQRYEIKGVGSTPRIARFLSLLERNRRVPILHECRVYGGKEGDTRFELTLVVHHKVQKARVEPEEEER